MIYGNVFLKEEAISIKEEYASQFLFDYCKVLESYLKEDTEEIETLEESNNSDIKDLARKAKNEFESNCKKIKKAMDKDNKKDAKAALAAAKASLKKYKDAIDDVDESVFSVASGFFCGLGKGLIMSLLPVIGITLSKAQEKGAGAVVGAIEVLGTLAGGAVATIKGLILNINAWMDIFETLGKEMKSKKPNYLKLFNSYRNLTKTELKLMEQALGILESKINQM